MLYNTVNKLRTCYDESYEETAPVEFNFYNGQCSVRHRRIRVVNDF